MNKGDLGELNILFSKNFILNFNFYYFIVFFLKIKILFLNIYQMEK